jgi:hypothetical protein
MVEKKPAKFPSFIGAKMRLCLFMSIISCVCVCECGFAKQKHLDKAYNIQERCARARECNRLWTESGPEKAGMYSLIQLFFFVACDLDCLAGDVFDR